MILSWNVVVYTLFYHPQHSGRVLVLLI
ncbi:hypothetical protein Pint_14037 [Pistacia integerrima]|uniref:Uncharacterized protein n=1 Tax=Pistacia integerrima TaxID=434235 RepID=A0ACC0Y3B9_9ROSI|nr:hypothetical protein Pint_14037 [Pistacia integerrima]